MNNIIEDIDNYMYELEDLSSKMAEKVSIGNFVEISKMDQERKKIINKISFNAANIKKKHKTRLKLVWINNEKLIEKIGKNLIEKKKYHSKVSQPQLSKQGYQISKLECFVGYYHIF